MTGTVLFKLPTGMLASICWEHGIGGRMFVPVCAEQLEASQRICCSPWRGQIGLCCGCWKMRSCLQTEVFLLVLNKCV